MNSNNSYFYQISRFARHVEHNIYLTLSKFGPISGYVVSHATSWSKPLHTINIIFLRICVTAVQSHDLAPEDDAKNQAHEG